MNLSVDELSCFVSSRSTLFVQAFLSKFLDKIQYILDVNRSMGRSFLSEV